MSERVQTLHTTHTANAAHNQKQILKAKLSHLKVAKTISELSKSKRSWLRKHSVDNRRLNFRKSKQKKNNFFVKKNYSKGPKKQPHRDHLPVSLSHMVRGFEQGRLKRYFKRVMPPKVEQDLTKMHSFYSFKGPNTSYQRNKLKKGMYAKVQKKLFDRKNAKNMNKPSKGFWLKKRIAQSIVDVDRGEVTVQVFEGSPLFNKIKNFEFGELEKHSELTKRRKRNGGFGTGIDGNEKVVRDGGGVERSMYRFRVKKAKSFGFSGRSRMGNRTVACAQDVKLSDLKSEKSNK